jgi:hypothetical protein
MREFGTEDYGLRSLQVLREGGILVEVPSGANESVLAAAERQSKRATGFLVEPDHLGLEYHLILVGRGSRPQAAASSVRPAVSAARRCPRTPGHGSVRSRSR